MRYVTKDGQLAALDDGRAPTDRFAADDASFALWLTTSTVDLDGPVLTAQLLQSGCRVHETRAAAERALRGDPATRADAPADAESPA